MFRHGAASTFFRAERHRFWSQLPATTTTRWFTLSLLVSAGTLGIATALLGCAPSTSPPPERPSLTLPIDIAGGAREPDRAPAPAASTGKADSEQRPAAANAAPKAKPAGPPLDAPDPKPLRSRTQYELTLLYDQGAITVEHVERVEHRDARVTPRRLGRWALELCVGREVIERFRFDFPLLAGEEPPLKRHPLNQKPSFAPGARVALTLSLPESDRATFARLVDRETGEVMILPWPPTLTAAAKKNSQPATATPAAVHEDAATPGGHPPEAPGIGPPASSAGPP